MRLVLRLRCQVHMSVVCVDDNSVLEFDENNCPYIDTETAWCDRRESLPDPVEAGDCKRSWTASLVPIKDEDNDSGHD